MKLNEQQERLLKSCYDFVENFKFPEDIKLSQKATAEYALKMETIKTLELIKVSYSQVK